MAIKTIPQTLIDTKQDATFARSLVSVARKKERASELKLATPKLFHWVKDKPDKRDYIYQLRSSTVPSKVDLRPFCTLIEDQGSLGSCTGQAIAGAIEYLNKKNGKTNDVSRLFIYYWERVMLGTVNYDSGAYIRDGIKSVFRYGAPLENLWPYIISRFRNRPSIAAMNDGARRRVMLYERATDFNAVKDALSNGFPVTVGFYVYSSFMSRIVTTTGMMPYPNTARERFLGGHAVLLVGYDDETQKFIARNSWGTRWGDNGYFYMPYQVIQNTSMSEDFWVIKTVNNP